MTNGKMEWKEIIDLYLDWALQRKPNVTEEQVIEACLSNRYTFEAISQDAEAIIDYCGLED